VIEAQQSTERALEEQARRLQHNHEAYPDQQPYPYQR
jgi:hypothetical protein